MDKFKSMQVFRAIVEQGSFKDAAKHLYMSKPMISKYLAFLENDLQAKLLYRNNRQHTLTEIGTKYYLECCHILDTVAVADNEARQNTIQPQGILKISAPVWFSHTHFTDLIAEFADTNPKIQLELTLSNELIDLIAGGFDIALRVTHRNLPDHFIAKPLVSIPFNYVASPCYLRRYGRPKTKEELIKHQGILPSYTKVETTLPARHRSNNTVMLYKMAIAGMGIAVLPARLTKDDVVQGRLIELFPLYDEPLTLYAAYIDRVFLSVKVRLFLDFLSEKL